MSDSAASGVPIDSCGNVRIDGAGGGRGFGLGRATRRDWIIALTFGALMVVVLAAGADRPPPLGFVVVPILAAALVFVVAAALPRWRAGKGFTGCFSWRGPLLQGAVAGLVVWLITFALPFNGEPTLDPTLGQYLIGAAVMAMLGAVCASVLAALA